MAQAVRIADDLFEAAKNEGKYTCRSAAAQVEYWARLGKAQAKEARNEMTEAEWDALFDTFDINAPSNNSIQQEILATGKSYVAMEDDVIYEYFPDGSKKRVEQ